MLATPSKHIYHSIRYNPYSFPKCQASKSADSTSVTGRNIAIAVDTSPDSLYACQWALNNVIRPGDTVHLLHCLPTLPRTGLYTLPDGRLAIVDYNRLMSTEEEYLKAAERAIAQSVYNIFHPVKVPYIIHLLREDPYASGDKGVIARDLCAKSDELQASALIISSHTRSQLSELFVGSVANFCTHSCSQPVLVLHAPHEEEGKNNNKGRGGTNAIARWLGELLQLGQHPETKGTAAESVAASAASNVVASTHRPDPKIVTSNDFSDGQNPDKNLVGQGVGLDTNLDSSLSVSLDVSAGEENVLGQVVGLEDDLTAAQNPAKAASASLSSGTNAGGGPSSGQNTGRKIVVAVDDTEASERACQWAVDHVWRSGDKLFMVHIVPSMPRIAYSASPNFGGGESFAVVLDPPNDKSKAEVEEYLQKRFLPMIKGVEYTSDVLLEPTEDSVAGVGRAICSRADELEADVVVLGSHVRGGLEEFLLGSVAQWVAHHCSAPVAVLH